jgi:tetrahydromethanopterin S-methyltransferase subunit E
MYCYEQSQLIGMIVGVVISLILGFIMGWKVRDSTKYDYGPKTDKNLRR